jgi:hypothetical protein
LSASVVSINISCPNLSSIIAKDKAYVRFNTLVTEHLQLDLDHSELSIHEFQIEKADIQAAYSQIRLHQGKLNTLSVRLIDKSILSCSENINKVDIEKDSSSKYHLN